MHEFESSNDWARNDLCQIISIFNIKLRQSTGTAQAQHRHTQDFSLTARVSPALIKGWERK